MERLLNFFRNKSVPSDNEISAFSNLGILFEKQLKSQELLLKTLNFFFQATDSLSIAIWIKDQNHRYITANRKLRDQLFDGRDLPDIIGRTDDEIIFGQKSGFKLKEGFSKLKPEELPSIDAFFENKARICNLTDLITTVFNFPCSYLEVVNNLTLIVYKFPLYENENLSGTFGFYYDVTKNSKIIKEKVRQLAQEKRAYKIDGSESYYLTDFKRPTFSGRDFL